MATLMLGAVGAAVGGPLGGAVGALLGRQVDGALLGGRGKRRLLKELDASSSSYGQPIARHYGAMRAGGMLIWASSLREQRERQGGKLQPQTSTVSYTVSLAVALSSRPIAGVGRIWADGNLLRGQHGDLKVPGTLRVHCGWPDQKPDPLLLKVYGGRCPAHRGTAYAVLEDLQLAEFGNRIPALTFELLAGDAAYDLLPDLAGVLPDTQAETRELSGLGGYAVEGESVRDALLTLSSLYPISARAAGAGLQLGAVANSPTPRLLPQPTAWTEGEWGQRDGRAHTRQAIAARGIQALRYYDLERDYQPGLQRAGTAGAAGLGQQIEVPAALRPADARRLATAANERVLGQGDVMTWRLAELDPAFDVSMIVRAPGQSGLWRIAGWEWRGGGIELELVQHIARPAPILITDPGVAALARDRVLAPTLLRVFELPPERPGAGSARAIFAALSGGEGDWKGASLYAEQDGTLVPLTAVPRTRQAVVGIIEEDLLPSRGLLFEAGASVMLKLSDPEASLQSASLAMLANGANRLLVGGEVLQFAIAEPFPGGRWRLSGLLRGRGGTEPAAMAGHPSGTSATLLDERLVALEDSTTLLGAPRVLAIGLGDDEPVAAAIEGTGDSRLPLAPVHVSLERAEGGETVLRWTRRARGNWEWLNGVEVPLTEEKEHYRVGVGPVEAPAAVWTTYVPWVRFSPEDLSLLTTQFAGQPLWVQQRGTFGLSRASRLAQPLP